jgi:hypothetical protein
MRPYSFLRVIVWKVFPKPSNAYARHKYRFYWQSAFNSGILTVFYRVEFRLPFSKDVYPEFRNL